MPNVDFTLEDIAQQTGHIIEQALIQEREHTRELIEHSLVKEREHTKKLIEHSLEAERAHTRELIQASFEAERAHTHELIQRSVTQGNESVKADLKQFITGEFLSFWEHNLEPAFEDLHNELAETKEHFGRLIGQHSKDIMELRARRG